MFVSIIIKMVFFFWKQKYTTFTLDVKTESLEILDAGQTKIFDCIILGNLQYKTFQKATNSCQESQSALFFSFVARNDVFRN